jgi:hypothetical protein
MASAKVREQHVKLLLMATLEEGPYETVVTPTIVQSAVNAYKREAITLRQAERIRHDLLRKKPLKRLFNQGKRHFLCSSAAALV